MTKSKKYIKRAHSKAALTNFTWGKVGGTVFPNFSFKLVIDLLEKDPVARGALNHFVDKCVEGDYAIIKRDNLSYDKAKELTLDEKYKFRTEILRKIYLMGKLFNNVFIEVVRAGDGSTKALNVLDTMSVDAQTAPNGDLVKLVSKTRNPVTGEEVTWSKDDITWIKLGDRTVGWAPVDMKALWENLLLKQYIRNYSAWLWKTGQYRLMYNFKNASKADIDDFMAFNRRYAENFDVPAIAKGEMETKILRDMKETDSLIGYLKYLDNQTLILMRIPPNDAGIPDASGRSNADAQANNLSTTIISFKKTIEDYLNFDLFNKINMGTYLIRYGPIDRYEEKQVFEVVQIMQSLNLSDELMQEYIKDRGLYFGEKKYFKEPEVDPLAMAAGNPRGKDMAPSRLGKGAGEGNKPAEAPTTRPDQLKAKVE